MSTSGDNSSDRPFGQDPDGPDLTDPLTAADIMASSGADDALAELPTKDNQASRLVALAQHRYRIIIGTDGRPYAVERHGPAIAIGLRGRDGLRNRLARQYYDAHRQAPGGSALTDALTVLEGQAATAEPEPVALRVAATATGATALDLGDTTGRAVTVNAEGWEIVERSPVLFRRTALTSPLPAPIAGGTLDTLRSLINVDESGWRLIVGWLLAALQPDIAHPILALIGEQGTAKSTAARLVATLIDPSPAPLRTPPRDLRSWAVTASASWTVALDNISTIPPWFSDTLCKSVTGDGIVDRALFTDDDVTVLSFRRVVALTSIDAGRLAGDLAERLLPIELARIPTGRRRTDAEINDTYNEARPEALGALLDLHAQVLAAQPNIHLDELPRMADFARLLAALDHTTGWTTLTDYTAAAAQATETVLENDPIADAIQTLASRGPWTGTAAQLLDQLPTPDRPPRDWPHDPRSLSGKLRRLAPALRAGGTTVDFTQSGGRASQRLITLRGADPFDITAGNFATPATPATPTPQNPP